MKTIVSLYPGAIATESRAYKQAASFARFGYRSVVIEGIKSQVDKSTLPFELISPNDERVGNVLSAEDFYQTFETAIIKVVLGVFKPLMQLLRQIGLGSRSVEEFFSTVEWLYFNMLIPVLHKSPKADVYYLHSFQQFPAVYLLCRKHKAHYIYDAHDYYAAETRHSCNNKPLIKWLLLLLERQAVARADTLVTVNEGVAQLLKREFGRDFLVLYNYHDARLDMSVTQNIRELLDLSVQDFLIVSIGNNKEYLAIQNVFEAMTMLPDRVHLAFVGRGYETCLEEIYSKELENRVHLIGQRKSNEIVPFIKAADLSLILYFSSYDFINVSLPNKFFMSIAAELPMLFPDLPEMRQIADLYTIGVQIDPLFPITIKEAVLMLYHSPKRLEECKKSLSHASLALNWENEEHILYDIIKQTF
jgi:hypothetical protein